MSEASVFARYQEFGEGQVGADLCTEDGCPKRQVARGLCQKHYMRVVRAGGWTESTPGVKPWSELPVNKMKRHGIKRTPDDRKFSKMIRERDGHTCQRCGKAYPPNSQGLHCAHMFSRGKMSTRLDPANARACCYGCHRYIDTHPDEKRQFFRDWLGDEAFEALERRSNTPYRGRAPKVKSEKRCSLCKEVKPIEDFYFVKRADGTVHYTPRCKPCVLEGQRPKSRDELDRRSYVRRLARYGLSVAEYEAMVERQQGLCAICRQPPDGASQNSETLHIDHDHRSGVVRGLLCGRCNTGIGLLDEDPARLADAIAYLQPPPSTDKPETPDD